MTIEKRRTTTRHYEQLRDILGKKNVRTKIESPFDFITIASKGVSVNIIVNFRNHFNIPRAFLAELLNVSEPTIYRWIRGNKKLDKNYSVQIFELADLFLYGTEVFEDQHAFFKWLELPNTALGGLEPKELSEVPGGVAKVRELLGRIDHGVYS